MSYLQTLPPDVLRQTALKLPEDEVINLIGDEHLDKVLDDRFWREKHIQDFGQALLDKYPIEEPIRNYYLLTLIWKMRHKIIKGIDSEPRIQELEGETDEDRTNENFNIEHRIDQLQKVLKHYEKVKNMQEKREKYLELLNKLRNNKWPRFVIEDPEDYDILYEGGSMYNIVIDDKWKDLSEKYLLKMLKVKFGILSIPNTEYFDNVIWQIYANTIEYQDNEGRYLQIPE